MNPDQKPRLSFLNKAMQIEVGVVGTGIAAEAAGLVASFFSPELQVFLQEAGAGAIVLGFLSLIGTLLISDKKVL